MPAPWASGIACSGNPAGPNAGQWVCDFGTNIMYATDGSSGRALHLWHFTAENTSTGDLTGLPIPLPTPLIDDVDGMTCQLSTSTLYLTTRKDGVWRFDPGTSAFTMLLPDSP